VPAGLTPFEYAVIAEVLLPPTGVDVPPKLPLHIPVPVHESAFVEEKEITEESPTPIVDGVKGLRVTDTTLSVCVAEVTDTPSALVQVTVCV